MAKKLNCYNSSNRLEKSFDTIVDAAAYINMDESSLRKALKSGKSIYKGFTWVFEEVDTRESKLPKILLLDIETAPIKAYVWKIWKENISTDQMISDWFMLCWSAKFLFSDQIYSNRLSVKEVTEENDSRICTNLWGLLNDADIIIAHNGSKFDIPKINARFLVNGLVPPTPYRQIDTLIVAKKEFGFTSNKLDSLAKLFGFERKLKTDFQLWVDCLNGNEKALAYMEEYNRYDVILLEDVYLKMRPYIKNHPNLALYAETDVLSCPSCLSDNMEVSGNYHTHTGKYYIYRCNHCGALSRSRENLLPKGLIKAIPTNLAY